MKHKNYIENYMTPRVDGWTLQDVMITFGIPIFLCALLLLLVFADSKYEIVINGISHKVPKEHLKGSIEQLNKVDCSQLVVTKSFTTTRIQCKVGD